MFNFHEWINIDNINWNVLSKNPNAIEILKQNQDKIDWTNLSLNPNAYEILKLNQDKIDLSLVVDKSMMMDNNNVYKILISSLKIQSFYFNQLINNYKVFIFDYLMIY